MGDSHKTLRHQFGKIWPQLPLQLEAALGKPARLQRLLLHYRHPGFPPAVPDSPWVSVRLDEVIDLVGFCWQFNPSRGICICSLEREYHSPPLGLAIGYAVVKRRNWVDWAFDMDALLPVDETNKSETKLLPYRKAALLVAYVRLFFDIPSDSYTTRLIPAAFAAR